jgi:MFS family permease
MFFEVTMIQRLVQFLGYPTYSLTVTLAAMLISTGLGALLSRRFTAVAQRAVPIALAVLAALTVFYLFVLPSLLTGWLLSQGLTVRIIFAVALLFPLGLCLGMFMPLGLSRIGAITDHEEEYVAWAWAVNGFFAVIGSVLTTILSMSFGFRLVQGLALGVYAIATLAFLRLPSRRPDEPPLAPQDEAVMAAV